MYGEMNVELFSEFVGRAKSTLTTLIDNIKNNIKEYETKIEETAKEISDNELSREKCEHEITKMESKIESIKDAIENVENTYKKMVDAYSSTSKGDTKELYSEIIDGAKANCEKDVEKNRSEIARLNSDIEAIKNNIAEFTKIIEELNKDLDVYNTELYRFTKSLEYMERIEEQTLTDLTEISSKKEPKITKKSEIKRTVKVKEEVLEPIVVEKEEEIEEVIEEPLKTEEEAPKVENKLNILDSIHEEYPSKVEEKENIVVEEPKKVVKEPEISFEESLKQLYDMTGYKPKEVKEEPIKKVEPIIPEKPVFTDNLENLFANPTRDLQESKEVIPFAESDMASWEDILNTPASGETNIKKTISENVEDTVNQLLNPYGTTYARLVSLTADTISYKDGSEITFNMTTDDVIKAINAIDGIDLKKMKTVGPEITLLRKIKDMKEGNL